MAVALGVGIGVSSGLSADDALRLAHYGSEHSCQYGWIEHLDDSLSSQSELDIVVKCGVDHRKHS